MKFFIQKGLCCFFIVANFLIAASSFSQTSPLSFTPIPFSNPDLNAPGRGAEQWHYGNEVNIPVYNVATPRLDVYFRFQWYQFETAQGVYDWSDFDDVINAAIDAGKKFSFGIMTAYTDAEPGFRAEFDDGFASYPEYLHDLMQGETAKDWKTGAEEETIGPDPDCDSCMWVPNWNSTYYLTRFSALLTALNTHINNSSHGGVAYKNAIGYVDIRGYGNYGEWHESFIVQDSTQHPAGTWATIATRKAIIDAHINAFPNFPLVAMIATFDAYWLQSTMNAPQVGYYALTATNNWGKIGWRKDSYGATDDYLAHYLELNNRLENDNGDPQPNSLIMDRYKFAPIVGEPVFGGDYTILPKSVRDYHTSSFGNSNYGALDSVMVDSIRLASKLAGYRIIIDTGSITTTITPGSNFSVTLNWKNTGIAPTYEYWRAVYELKNGSGTTVWSSNSGFQLKLFLPRSTDSVYTDNLSLPGNISPGNYTLNLIIKDTNGFRAPFPLAITGRNGDGSYTLKNIMVTGSCTKPTAVIANTASCDGAAFNLTLASATGTSPYDLIINGVTHNDKTVGNTITSFTPPTQKIWTSNPSANSWEDNPLELGVKFTASESGFIKGIRFFSHSEPEGTYTGHLWSSSGVLLASATFSSVTGSAWQEVVFSTPVHITASTTYTASYHTAAGLHAYNLSALSSPVTNGSLTALANGVFAYGSSAVFPASYDDGTNYWVDVLFVADTYTFNLTSVADNTGCDSTGALQTLTVASTYPTAVLSNSSTCNGAAFNLTLSSATGASPYDLVINGVTYNDKTVGNTITSFTPSTQKIWTTNPTVTNNEDNPVELGVKFRSTETGYIKGVRFFSSNNPSGTYTGHLWTSSGTLLASATFSSVTTSAWQEVLFSTPVHISANTTYVASYYTAGGRYSSATSGLVSAVTNGSLTALASGSSGGNGVYTYGSSSAFPTSTFSNSHYWADVLFVPDTYTFNLTSVTDNNNCGNAGALQTLTVTSEVCGGGRIAGPRITETIIPDKEWNYSLLQSYPNPAQNETRIVYTIPENTAISLNLFDLHGKLVKVLVNGVKAKGSHTLFVNTGSLAKGVYYYSMHTKDFTATRKLVVQ
jgi:phage terminase large subunit-like protein